MESLPELFDSLAKRPQLYIYPVDYSTMKGFLTGLAIGLRFAGNEWTWNDYLAAAEARGWDPRGDIGVLRDFVLKDLSDEEIVREVVAIEADAYARALARTD